MKATDLVEKVEKEEKGLQLFISDGMIECDGLSEKDLGFLGENTEDEKLNIINQLFSKADLSGTSVRKPISDMTADWETELLRVERGEMEPETFMTESTI